jgi:DNA-binding transcriptional LysR family regulator
MDPDPRYLRAFLEVGRLRSVSAAAIALHRSQPAVSYQLQQLEQQLGVRLFDRSTRRLAPTAAGVALLDLCERFFAEFGRLAVGLRDPAAGRAPPLRIASVSGFGRYVLFPILERLAELRYALRFPTAEQVFASLHDGSCDVGFVYLPQVSSRLVTAAVWREELVLLAPRGRHRRAPTADELAGIPFVTYDEYEYVFGKWFETQLGRPPRSLHSAYHFEELEEVVRTVAAGRGWSIVPEPCIRAAPARQTTIVRYRRRVHNIVYVVTRASAAEHPAIAQVREALRAASHRR